MTTIGKKVLGVLAVLALPVLALAVIAAPTQGLADQCEAEMQGTYGGNADQLWAAQMGCATGHGICDEGEVLFPQVEGKCADSCYQTNPDQAAVCIYACQRAVGAYRRCLKLDFEPEGKYNN